MLPRLRIALISRWKSPCFRVDAEQQKLEVATKVLLLGVNNFAVKRGLWLASRGHQSPVEGPWARDVTFWSRRDWLKMSRWRLVAGSAELIFPNTPIQSGNKISFSHFNIIYKIFYDSDKIKILNIQRNTATIPSSIKYLSELNQCFDFPRYSYIWSRLWMRICNIHSKSSEISENR